MGDSEMPIELTERTLYLPLTNEDLERYQPTYRPSYPERSSYPEKSSYSERSFEREGSYPSGRYVCGRKYYCSQNEVL